MTQPTTESTLTKRAFAYLRVSSEGQVNTGYDRDGLSIAAQREAAADKAAQLNAEIVHEFSDPGKSAFVDLHRRTDFLAMLDELKRLNQDEATRIDYVIVWALNRWARNVQDHHRTRELVRQTGAQLVSITEPMVGEDTPEGFFMEGMFALNNQYESMKTGRNVSRGLLQKAKDGGTYGWAKLGYVNDVERLPDGRQVRSVSWDETRHPLITYAFELFSSGVYSLSTLADELYDLGLRNRPTRRHPGGKVGTSTLQRILRDPYYAGWIIYKKGTADEQTFRGRHEPLIDEDTFDRVQALLDAKKVAGERPSKRQHFLRGSVFCGKCRGRLSYALSRSKSGKRYAYYFCSCRVRGTSCSMRVNIPPRLIEKAVERYYVERPVELDAEQVAKRTEALEAMVAVSQRAVAMVKATKTALVEKLEAQQARLLRLHLEEGDEISPDAFREERKRLAQEVRAAKKSLAVTEEQLNLDGTLLRMALELAGDVAEVYRTADKHLKRDLNQAFFKKLLILPEWDEKQGELVVRVVDAELTEPYEAVLAADFAERAFAEAARIGAADTPEGDPGGAAFWQSVFVGQVNGGGGGIRTHGTP